MSRVKQARTSAEERVAQALRHLGVRYRRNNRTLPGKPDFSNQSQGWVIQVHGCFWHQHDCKRGALPAHNRALWMAKFHRNRERDAAVEDALRKRGLKVLTLWECETKALDEIVAKLAPYLR